MARSFAPSPTARHSASPIPCVADNACSVASFASRSRIGSATRPLSTAPSSSNTLARWMSKPHSSATLPLKNVKPPLTSAVTAPFARMVRTSVRAPGVSRTPSQVRSSADSGRPCNNATRSRRAAAKSSSPFMLRLVMLATRAPTPAKAANSSSVSPVTIVLSMSAMSSRFRRAVAGVSTASTAWPASAAASAAMAGGAGQGNSTASPADSTRAGPGWATDAARATSDASSRPGRAIRVRKCDVEWLMAGGSWPVSQRRASRCYHLPWQCHPPPGPR